MGKALSGFGEAMSRLNTLQTQKELRQNPPEDIFSDAVNKNFSYEEFNEDGTLDFILSYQRLNTLVDNSDLFLNNAKQEALQSIDSLKISSSAKQDIAVLVGKQFEKLGSELKVKNSLVQERDKFIKSLVGTLSANIQLNSSKTFDTANYIAPANELGLQEAEEFLESLSEEEKGLPQFSQLKTAIAMGNAKVAFHGTAYAFQEAIEQGEVADFISSKYVNVSQFDKWMSESGKYAGMEFDADSILKYTQAFSNYTNKMPLNFVKKVIEPFINQPTIRPDQANTYIAIAEAKRKVGIEGLSPHADALLTHFIVNGRSATAETINEIIGSYDTTQKPIEDSDLATSLKEITGDSVGLNELFVKNIGELEDLDSRFGNLTPGSENTSLDIFRRIQNKTIRLMLREGRLYGKSVREIKDELNLRSLMVFNSDNEFQSQAREAGIFEMINPFNIGDISSRMGYSTEYKVLPRVPSDRGIPIESADFERALESKLATILKYRNLGPDELKTEIERHMREGSVFKSNLNTNVFVMEIDGGEVLSISGEEIHDFVVNPMNFVDVDDITYGLNDVLKASVAMGPKSMKQVNEFYAWQNAGAKENLEEGYPYKFQASEILKDSDFKSLSKELQYDVLSYIGKRLNNFSSGNPMFSNAVFVNDYFAKSYDYAKSSQEYYSDLMQMNSEQLKAHLKDVETKSLSFDIMLASESIRAGMKPSTKKMFKHPIEKVLGQKVPSIMSAFRKKRTREKEGGTAVPTSMGPYVLESKTSIAELYKMLDEGHMIKPGSLDTLNEFLAVEDFEDNQLMLDSARYFLSIMLEDYSSYSEVPFAMKNKDVSKLVKKIVAGGN